MEYLTKINNYLNQYLVYYLTILLIIIIILSGGSLYYHLQPIKKTIIKTKLINNAKLDSKVIVDIKGAVNKPGVYQVTKDSIVNDVIILAGGLTKQADTSLINLSKLITNHMVIIIYTKGEIKNVPVQNCPDLINQACFTNKEVVPIITSSANSNIVNINTASKETLMTLAGIGETKALAIIAYRTSKPFSKIEDILNVSGIGNSTYAQIKESITI